MKRNAIRATLLLSLLLCVSAFADSKSNPKTDATALDRFFDKIQYLSADFEQFAISPQKKLEEKSEGRLYIRKPGHYRWEYLKPSPLLISSDGQSEWIYDEALNQVIIRNPGSNLGTPAQILSGLKDWRKGYKTSVEQTDKQREIITLKPLGSNREQVDSIRILLNEEVLRAIEVQDVLGYSNRIVFHNFQFRDPKARLLNYRLNLGQDVDVIDQR